MAEIRSTLDMVMERAARIAQEAEAAPQKNDAVTTGMRFGAAYLNGEEKDLLQLLKKQPPEEQMEVRAGMAKTFIRNIILPREGPISEQSLLSLQALMDLSGNAADISNICSELKQILDQYNQHADQVKQQFDESILNQLKQQLQQQGLSVSDEMALNPTMHPQYHEQWSQVVADLNEQYLNAIDQRKQAISQRFGI